MEEMSDPAEAFLADAVASGLTDDRDSAVE